MRSRENLGLQFLHRLDQRQSALLRALQHHAGGEQAVDFVGAFENPVDARIAIGVLARILLTEAVAAVNLDALIYNVIERFRREHFNEAAFGRELFDSLQCVGGIAGHVSFNRANHSIGHAFAGVHTHGHLSDFVLDHAEFADGLSERFAFLRVLDRVREVRAAASVRERAQLQAA